MFRATRSVAPSSSGREDISPAGKHPPTPRSPLLRSAVAVAIALVFSTSVPLMQGIIFGAAVVAGIGLMVYLRRSNS